MLAWIQSRPERRLLVLVDHADVLLEADLNTASATQEDARFPLATRLAELMRQSDGRVKFVLAGTVPLLRLARIEGYPLAARGCARLAPLLDHSGLREAQQLVLASLEHAVPETPGVLARMLSLANYAPETIQQLATLTAKRAPDGRVGPAVLDALTASHEGASATTRALRGAVQGDPRHAIILYSFALACRRPPQDEVEDVADGVSSQWLAARLAEWSGIHHPSSDGAVVDALLDEMIALNVLQLTERDRYILASPNLLPYLGRDEELFDTLLDQASALERSGTIEHLTP
jgi:hypothetical protein